ncbi:hypothetical protein EXIGLDRAFT_727273 [Exidia glandulosa HHB12029]|uniref:Fungal N-terminal domain-containing protein n=1 Tax=Exidia glandulosa HHB12029 TaxID=1314781 RepID=A0A165DF22_EXIGL|nr:hypothetical protein EXIGLDRAFT_727273 [Exidia glandulosa HHB12029]
MPIAAFTFGSFGDIATILQLAWTIRKSLDESAGSVAQVRTVVADIDSFTQALQQIKAALSARASVPTELMNGVVHALEQCFKLLTQVKSRIDSFNSRVSGAVGAGVVRKYWAALGWEILGGKREVELLRGRLLEQITFIQTLLAAAQSENLDEIKKAAEAHSQSLDDMKHDAKAATRNVSDMFASMRELCIRLTGTSTPFMFFDEGGAQLVPAGVGPPSMAEAFYQFSHSRDIDLLDSPAYYDLYHSRDTGLQDNVSIQESLNDSIRKGMTYIHVSFWYCWSDNLKDHQWRLQGPVNPQKLGALTYWNGNNSLNLEVLCFLYRGSEGGDVTAFISPVYGFREASWAALIPDASSALAGFLRGIDYREDLRGSGPSALAKLFTETVDYDAADSLVIYTEDY